MNSFNGKEKRMNLRFEYTGPVNINFTLLDDNNATLNNGSIEAYLQDIGAGGLRFISDADLEVNPSVIMEFYTMLPILFKGFIVRKKLREDNCFEYGVQFVSNGLEKGLAEDLLKHIFDNNPNNELNLDSTNNSYINRMNFLNNSSNISERRAYPRTKLSKLLSSLIILKINDKLVNSDNVCILDISKGGIRFISKVDVPDVEDIRLQFDMDFKNQKHTINGHIVRKQMVEENGFEYGVEFLAYEVNNENLTYLIETIDNLNQ